MAVELTISEFLTYVILDFKRDDKNTEIISAYNDTIRDIASRRPFGDYKFQSYTPLVANQEDYILPCSLNFFIHPLRFLEGSGANDDGYQLDHIEKKEYDELSANPNRVSPTNTGKPKRYCVYSRSILIDPLPDAVTAATGLLEMNWSRKPAKLTNNADSPLLNVNWKEILKFGVLFRLYSGMQQWDEAQSWRALYEDPLVGIPKMIRMENSVENSEVGKVRPNPF